MPINSWKGVQAPRPVQPAPRSQSRKSRHIFLSKANPSNLYSPTSPCFYNIPLCFRLTFVKNRSKHMTSNFFIFYCQQNIFQNCSYPFTCEREKYKTIMFITTTTIHISIYNFDCSFRQICQWVITPINSWRDENLNKIQLLIFNSNSSQTTYNTLKEFGISLSYQQPIKYKTIAGSGHHWHEDTPIFLAWIGLSKNNFRS